MATTITPPAVTNDTSIAELRNMLADPAPPPVNAKPAVVITQAAPEVEAKPETPEVVEVKEPARERDENGRFVPKAGATEAESGTAQIQDPKEEVEKEEPLPANVQKRIAKEVEKQARIDREIAEAVSRTKARQADLEKLRAEEGKPGPEPVKNTAPPKPEGKPIRPVRPIFGETEGQTWGEFTAAQKQYEKDLDKFEDSLVEWVESKSRKATAEEILEQKRQERVEHTIAESHKKYGAKEFDVLRARVVEASPEGLLNEMGMMDNWPEVVVYLGKSENEAELEKLTALYGQHPSAALRELGRIEDRLSKTATKEPSNGVTKEAVKEKPLPPPPERVGGGANAAPQTDFNKSDMRTFKREIAPLLERSY